MWICPKCQRIFEKSGQLHSCRKISLEKHFENKEKARELFNDLVNKIQKNIGQCKVISIPCCIHLFGNYDFLAALPKKDRLEIRFTFAKKLENPRVMQSVLMSAKLYKICLDVQNKGEIDSQLLSWLKTAYHLKDSKM